MELYSICGGPFRTMATACVIRWTPPWMIMDVFSWFFLDPSTDLFGKGPKALSATANIDLRFKKAKNLLFFFFFFLWVVFWGKKKKNGALESQVKSTFYMCDLPTQWLYRFKSHLKWIISAITALPIEYRFQHLIKEGRLGGPWKGLKVDQGQMKHQPNQTILLLVFFFLMIRCAFFSLVLLCKKNQAHRIFRV